MHKFLLLFLFSMALLGNQSAAQYGWVQQTSPSTDLTLRSVHFTDTFTGIAVGDSGRIIRTTDGGAHWTLQQSGVTTWLSDVDFADADNGIAVGGLGTILRTVDGGVTWAALQGGPLIGFAALTYPDPLHATIIGHSDGLIWHTTDGGASWVQQSTGSKQLQFDVYFTDSSAGTIVGDFGMIYRTTDGGTSWTRQIPKTTDVFYRVMFTDADHGTVVGEANSIFHTTDGGVTWNEQQPPSVVQSEFYDVSFSDANTGTLVGPSGTLIRTTDGGQNWVWQDAGVWSSLLGVSFTDANTGTIVGDRGTILRTTNGGVTWVESARSLPEQIALKQNHPNPFAVTTTIPITLSTPGYVTLKVYDVLGEEIRTLVDGELATGSRSFIFDATGLAPGVYYYVLSTAHATESRMMVINQR